MTSIEIMTIILVLTVIVVCVWSICIMALSEIIIYGRKKRRKKE